MGEAILTSQRTKEVSATQQRETWRDHTRKYTKYFGAQLTRELQIGSQQISPVNRCGELAGS